MQKTPPRLRGKTGIAIPSLPAPSRPLAGKNRRNTGFPSENGFRMALMPFFLADQREGILDLLVMCMPAHHAGYETAEKDNHGIDRKIE